MVNKARALVALFDEANIRRWRVIVTVSSQCNYQLGLCNPCADVDISFTRCSYLRLKKECVPRLCSRLSTRYRPIYRSCPVFRMLLHVSRQVPR